MTGIYGNLQARKKKFRDALFVPCSAHSLNLVGTHAMICCLGRNRILSFIQHKLVNNKMIHFKTAFMAVDGSSEE